MPANILAIPHKSSRSLSSHLSKAVRTYIAEHYTDTHPDAFADDIKHYVKLRDECCKLEVHKSCVDLASRYHAQLVFFATKFPANIGIAFSWTLSFSPSLPLWTSLSSSTAFAAIDDSSTPPTSSSASESVVSHPDLDYELASLLFSLAALYSSLGANESRSDKESLKRSLSYFQTAAGVLAHIRNKVVPQMEHLLPVCPDLTPAMLEALEQVMLAQAQECFWQQAILDGLKNATIAKLSQAVSEFYAAALEVTERKGPSSTMKTEDRGRADLPREWVAHITVKKHHFKAAAQFRKSVDDLESSRYGDEIGRLQMAEADAKRALEASKRNVSDSLISDLKSLQGVITTNLGRANKDNDLIYLEAVTSEASLNKIAPAVMVKSVLPKEIEDPFPYLRNSPDPAFGTPLFQALVPYGVHVAISVYEDRKETLIRDELTSRQMELDALASSTLQSLGLPGSLQAQDQTLPVPHSLLRKGDEIRLDGGVAKLQRLIADIAKIARTDAGILQEALAVLDEEAAEDRQVREGFSEQRWTRPSSEEAGQQYRSQVEEYKRTLAQARKSDRIVQQKLSDWEDTIDVLAGGEQALDAFIPKPSASSSKDGGATSGAARALRAAMEELDDIQESRAALVAEAEALGKSDDIRPPAMREAGKLAASRSSPSGSGASLIVQPSHFEPLFEDEMQKYSRFVAEMKQSAAAQEAKLEQIAELNKAFVESRSVDTTTKRREKALQNLDLAYAKYREMSGNLIEGLNFYNSLAKLLSDFRQNLKEWHRARQIDIAQLTANFAGTSLSNSVGNEASEGPARRTRAAQKRGAKKEDEQAPQQPPQWGKWQGQKIQFGD